jgi:hypothetical protein
MIAADIFLVEDNPADELLVRDALDHARIAREVRCFSEGEQSCMPWTNWNAAGSPGCVGAERRVLLVNRVLRR